MNVIDLYEETMFAIAFWDRFLYEVQVHRLSSNDQKLIYHNIVLMLEVALSDINNSTVEDLSFHNLTKVILYQVVAQLIEDEKKNDTTASGKGDQVRRMEQEYLLFPDYVCRVT